MEEAKKPGFVTHRPGRVVGNPRSSSVQEGVGLECRWRVIRRNARYIRTYYVEVKCTRLQSINSRSVFIVGLAH